MEEIWKDIPGYEGYYQVSNLGRIISFDKIVSFGTRKRLIKGRILKLVTNPDGYAIVSLYKDGQLKQYLRHRLIAAVFIPNPDNKRTINHKNGVKADNSVDNLEWMTCSENHLHAFRILNRKSSLVGKFGKLHHISRPIIKKDLNGNIIDLFDSVTMAARDINVNTGRITECCKGKINHINGFRYEYNAIELTEAADFVAYPHKN